MRNLLDLHAHLPGVESKSAAENDRLAEFLRTLAANGDLPRYIADVLMTGGAQGQANMLDLRRKVVETVGEDRANALFQEAELLAAEAQLAANTGLDQADVEIAAKPPRRPFPVLGPPIGGPRPKPPQSKIPPAPRPALGVFDGRGDLVAGSSKWWQKTGHKLASSNQRIAQSQSFIWKSMRYWKQSEDGRAVRTNGLSGRRKRLFTWDNDHPEIEVWDDNRNHLGAIDAVTGRKRGGPKHRRLRVSLDNNVSPA